MTTYAGIDLHSSNCYLGVINRKQQRLFEKRLPNAIDQVRAALKPFRKQLAGVAVESTYNWYWLVDGLQEDGLRVHLANPAAMQQYEGLKHTDDRTDAIWLATMLRLGILPEGYIYPKAKRPTRDLLRRRMLFVQQRTSHLLSLQTMVDRWTGTRLPSNRIRQLSPETAQALFEEPHLALSARCQVQTIGFLTGQIQAIENAILAEAKLHPDFQVLTSVPGIGKILALTIMLEVGDIRRFPSVGDYASYCRCVKSEKFSNGKKKGQGNHKNGNRYLGWAYVEAANFAVRYSPRAQAFYQRKRARTKNVVATKALANKLARATFYLLRDQTTFDEEKLFK